MAIQITILIILTIDTIRNVFIAGSEYSKLRKENK